MNRRVKQLFLECLRDAGVFGHLASSEWRNRRLLILGYHGVSLEDEHEWDPSLYISPEGLEQRLEILRYHGCTVLPLIEGLERLYDGRLPRRAAVLTFDDGTYDFYARAFPILKAYGYPATVYLTTYYSYAGQPIFDVSVSYMLWKHRGKIINSAGLMPGFPPRLCLDTASGRARAVRAIHAFARAAKLGQAGKNECLRRLAVFLRFPLEEFTRRRCLQIMKPGEVSELASAGVDFQLHTHRHRVPLDEDLFAREIDDNRAAIASMTGRVPRHFCYPSNVVDCEFLPWLTKLGVVSATTCEPGLASKTSHPLLLPRLVDGADVPAVEFASWISGVSGFFHPADAARRCTAAVPPDDERPPLGMEGERRTSQRRRPAA